MYSKSSKIKVQKGILLFKQTGIVRYYSLFSLIIYQGLTLKYENYSILFIKTSKCTGGEKSLLCVGPNLVSLSHVSKCQNPALICHCFPWLKQSLSQSGQSLALKRNLNKCNDYRMHCLKKRQ